MVDATIQAAEAEIAVALEGGAPFANKVLLTQLPAMARLSFLEVQLLEDGKERPHFRGAVTIGIADVIQLHALLGRTIDRLVESGELVVNQTDA